MSEPSVAWLELATAVLPLVGVALGAGLQFIFSRSAEIRRHERVLRVQAYSDYLRSVGEMEGAKAIGDPAKKTDALSRAIEAKARVCVHGSSDVVTALAQFEGDGEKGLTECKKKYFLRFLEAVRADTGAKGAKLSTDSIDKILFERG